MPPSYMLQCVSHAAQFRSASRTLYRSVKVRRTPAGIETLTPHQVVAIPASFHFQPYYAVSPDGQRFLFIRTLGDDRASVVLNWTSQLKPEDRRR